MKREYSNSMDPRMFDFYEFYRRVAKGLPNNAKVAEVGVANGTSAIYFAEKMLNLEKKEFSLQMIDNLAYGGQDQLQEIIKHVCASGVGPWVNVVPLDSLSASCRYPDGHFDFVFIDSAHTFEVTKAEIRLWFHKVKIGGILAGHDYNADEVKQAVDLVVPGLYTRDPIPGQPEFTPEQILQVEETPKGFGVWWFKKYFYLRLN